VTTTTIPISRWQAVGTAVALPQVLASSRVALRFEAHADYGVVLADVLDAMVDQVSGTQHHWPVEAAPLWSIVANRIADSGDDSASDSGGGQYAIFAGADVEVTSTTDRRGHPALCMRWLGVEREDGGTFDITAMVSLGPDDPEARWWISVRRDSDGDGIEYVEFPRLSFSISDPLTTRTRVLLPTLRPPAQLDPIVTAFAGESGGTFSFTNRRLVLVRMSDDLSRFVFFSPPWTVGETNSPIEDWADLPPYETAYPTGDSNDAVQQLQIEALATVFPGDELGPRPRCLLLMCDDRSGHHRRWSRQSSGTAYVWRHRYIPAWSRHPVLGNQSASEEGTTFYAPYEVLVGALTTLNASWWHACTTRYREVLEAKGVECLPRGVDDVRSGPSRGRPMVLSRGPNGMDPKTAARIVVADAEAVRSFTGADRVSALISDVRPALAVSSPRLTDFRTMRGTNWIPAHATWGHCLHLWAQPMGDPSAPRPVAGKDGYFHPLIIDAELDEIARVGFNSVRVRGSLMGWVINPANYMASLAYVCRALRARGMGLTYELWTSTPAGFAALAIGSDSQSMISSTGYSPSALMSSLWTLCDGWQITNAANIPANQLDLSHWPEPLSGVGWLNQGRMRDWTDGEFRDLVVGYLHAIAEFFANNADAQAVHDSIDLYNEPDVVFSPGGSTARQQAQIKAAVTEFIAWSGVVIRRTFSAAQFTIGGTSVWRDVVAMGCALQYVSAHYYAFATDPAKLDAQLLQIQSAIAATAVEGADVAGTGPAAASGIPGLITECYVRPENSGRMRDYLDAMDASGIGGQTWSHLRNNGWRSVAGLGPGQPFDGIRECTTPAKLITTGMLVPDVGDDVGDDAGPALAWQVNEPEDDLRVRQWTGSAP